MSLKKLVYLGYYLKNIDAKKLSSFLKYAKMRTGKSRLTLFLSAIKSVFVYNISILEYFQFRFFEIKREEHFNWAGTGFMFEYQKKMNPLRVRSVLENKILFNKHFNAYFGRGFATIEDIKRKPEIAEKLIKNPSGKVVLKNSLGQAGKEIKVLDNTGMTPSQLINIMRSGKFDLVEEYIVQHPEMMKLSSAGLNTIRIVTQEVNGNIEIVAARLRITINSVVDNLAAGNAAAPVDLESGKISGSAVFSDITKPDISVHPVSGAEIPGFQIPLWSEIIEMIEKAALMVPENRSVGWDIAVTQEGPLLVEGNHNWCKLLWQLPVKQGLKGQLLKYL